MSATKKIPREEGIDHTFNLIREGYMYMINRFQSFQSNIFETRLLGKRAVCMRGKEAAEIFYDPDKFQRKGVTPKRAMETLLGKKGVQTLDGIAHRHRKEMFMSIMTSAERKRLMEIVNRMWENAITEWEKKNRIIFYEEMKELLCRAACEWTGVPVEEREIKKLTSYLGAMFESAGAFGWKHWLGKRARNKVEKWMESRIEKVRERRLLPPENTALYRFAWHRELDGSLIDTKIAAVEVINIIRPIVAIAIFINFIVLALDHYPEERKKFLSEDQTYAQMFIQEVRRFYPFFPFVMALAKKDFTWNGYPFKKGTLTLLDLYGTNHDPEIWDHPEKFSPARFTDQEQSPFNFIPQGGGDHLLGHRCAGEWVTMEIMKVSANFLTKHIEYELPDQDLSYRMVRIPSIPRSKIILANVRKKK